jgi:hypothetical protein
MLWNIAFGTVDAEIGATSPKCDPENGHASDPENDHASDQKHRSDPNP